MKLLIPTVALLLVCLHPLRGQYQIIDQVDWSLSAAEDRSGNASSNQPWDAVLAGECDSNGFFGADPAMGVFRIEDTEGTCGCDCIANDPNPLCGQNDNILNINLLGTPFAHCQTRIRFTVEANGVKCGNNDQYTTAPSGCPADDSYLGTDLLTIQIIADDLPGVENISLCGANGTGEYVVELNASIFVQMQVSGGTQQAGEYYTISNVVFEGLRNNLPPTLNATVLTADAEGEICENGLPIILKTIANASYDYQWLGPDNFFSNDDAPVIQNPTPANSGTYYVTVTDPSGCQADHQVSVVVLPASNSKCTTNPTFDNLNASVCSDVTLPSVSDNGIPGSWSPGANLSLYAGQTLEFIFTPSDPNISAYSQELFVDDISLLNNFGTQEQPVPIFCNTISATYDFIDIFQLNLDMELSINGENEIFDFIEPGEYLNDHINELRNLSFASVTPGIKDFFIEAVTPCGEIGTKTFQFIVSSEVDPLQIDTVLCEGDFIEFGGIIFDINNPYGFVDDGYCDSSLVVNLTFKPKKKNPNPLVFSGSCGGDIIYYYDTIVAGEHIGFVGGKIAQPPYGPNFLDVFTSSFNGNYTMPIPASNGCDSIQRLIISLIEAEFDTIAFDLCSNRDTFVNVAGIGGIMVNAKKPFQIVGDCDVTIIDANIIQVLADTVQKAFCADQDTIIDGILFNIDHPRELIFYERGANGCSASKLVDLTFYEPVYSAVNERICLGDFIDVGGQIFSQNTVNQEVILPRQAATGCDSIVVVNLEVVTPMTEQVEVTICKEDTFEFLGESYGINKPFGFPRIPSVLGCDSLLYNVSLTFYEADDITLDPVLCFGESMTFSEYGITIDQNFLQGSVVHTTSDGCLQNILVNATMLTENVTEVALELCAGGSIDVNGTAYDELNPTGTEIFPAANGCDSIVNIALTFRPVIQADLTLTICQGGSIEYNGTTYDENNPSGIEQFTTADGCDSLVNVSLNVNPVLQSDVVFTICQGGSIEYNGTTYDENNPSGIEQFTTVDGCDSLVNVSLNVNPVLQSDVVFTICQGGSIEYNGTTYDENNPSGIEQFTTADGCDSLVNVSLNVNPVLQSDVVFTICQGGSIEYNGTIYDENNPGGIEQFTTVDGCDSLVNVSLTVNPVLESDVVFTICQGGSIEYNGTTYDENNPSGIEQFTTVDGCDSLVNVSLTVNPVLESDVVFTICQGGSIEYNGTTYDENNPSGIEQFTTADGCDSLVNVSLNVNPVLQSDVVFTICQGGSVDYNGTTYDESNLSGVEQFTTADGCDSLVNVSLIVNPVKSIDLNINICQGGAFIYNGTIYDESNLSGTEVFSTVNGCDSLVNVILTVNPILTSDLTQTICAGESFVYNGVTYDESNTSGTALLTTADGCDSLVNVFVVVQSPTTINIDTTICPNGFIRVEGEIFRGDVTTTLIVPSVLGCDSLIYEINLELHEIIPITLDPVICYGEVYIDPVYGVEINAGNANTTVIVTNAFGCDQPLNLKPVLVDELIVNYSPQICRGESITINGNVYDEANPTGVVVIESSQGCDSTVNIAVVVTDIIRNDLTTTLCPGESVLVNGNVYNENNPMGVELMTSSKGCDSIITVDLSYYQTYDVTVTQHMCEEEIMMINGTVYDFNNRNGTEVLQTINGCDSLVRVDLTFSQSVTEIYVDVICSNETIDIHGQTYDADQFTDSRVLTDVYGCDSIIIQVDLSVLPVEEEFITDVLCEDESVVINGVTYDIDNKGGIEVIPGGGTNGCDKIIYVEYTFELDQLYELNLTLCPGENFTLGGETFDETMPVGSVTLQSVNGCDSVVDVTLTFYDINLEIGGIIGSCEGVANGSFVISNAPGATPPFTLSGLPEGDLAIANLPYEVKGLLGGAYTYQFTDANGCGITGNVTIPDDRSANLDITVTTIDPLSTFDLQLTSTAEVDRIEWVPNRGLSCLDCDNPQVRIEETTTFEVNVFDPDGCVSSTSVTVFIDEVGNIYIPNVISITSNSGNEILYVRGEDGVEALVDMIIYDRWGNKVFEQRDAPINQKEYGWDGRYQDNILNSGVYVYSVKVRIPNGAEIMLSGDITVLK